MKIAQRVQQLRESTTLAVSARAAEMRAAGLDVVSFGAGEPDFDTPEPIKQAATAALARGLTKYPKPSSGLAETKEAIRLKYQRENGLDYLPRQIVVTVGCKLACYLALQALLDPGDEAIVIVPYWVSYPELIQLAGGKPVFVRSDPTRAFPLPGDGIAAAVSPRTRMIIINSPNNPGGFIYRDEDLRAVAEIARQHDLTIMSDETYDRLLFGGRRHVSIASLSPDAYSRTLTLNSASKTYAMTGWRVGYAAGPEPVIQAMAKLESQATSGVSTFLQVALAHALTSDQGSVEIMRAEFERRGRHMARRLNDIPGIHCHEPAGAFYCFPSVVNAMVRLGIQGSEAFAQRLLHEAHVAVVPGAAFGCDDHIRLSFATNLEQIDKGLDRLAAWLSKG